MVKVENLTMDPVPDVSFEVGPVSESARGEARPEPRETGLSGIDPARAEAAGTPSRSHDEGRAE